MKKDYIVISETQTTTDERSFVEDFWTQRWDKLVQLPQVDLVGKRQEYRLMQPYLQKLPAGSRILDGGCGMGEWTVFMTNQGFQVVGLDVSRRTIARLNEFFPNYQFVCGDIRYTEFADETFEAYFSWGTFEHFESGLGDCMKEAYRLLKPGGYLFVSVPYQNWRHILQDIKGTKKRDKDAEIPSVNMLHSMRFYQWRLTGPELERELTIHGFTVLRVVPIHIKEGLKRTLHHVFSIKRGSRWHRRMTRYLRRVVPKNLVAHMIMAIAQKNKR
jgi:SAM-dependent methyltransferase